ncbi:DUF1636 family protein [Neoaquamicrobium sediminum]|uniref:DUF1636 family protein n=1 Tax=Neoaquamicrobium sediminum TaxID=1849104 RepID=UPI003BACB8FD
MTDIISGELKPGLNASSADSETASAVTIIVCSSCRYPGTPAETFPRPGSALADSTRKAAAGSTVDVRQVACLGNCKRGLSAAVLRAGSWSYIFGELDAGSAADLVTGAELFAGSSDGFMPFRNRPEALKRGLIARVPTAANLQDLK